MLYPCAITHVRTGTASRSFTYGSYLWLVDVDRLPRLPAPLRPLATFAVRDHFGDPAAPSIRANVESFLRRHDIDLGGGRIMMLAGARILGYQFNPLTVFWCYDAAGRRAAVLAEPTRAEREILGAFRYSASEVALHTDDAVLPRSAAVRSSWNYLLSDCAGSAEEVHVSYYLNRLQRLAEPENYIVTLNTLDRVRPDRVIETMHYEHPLYTPESVAAQRRLGELSSPVLAYAGAYHGWGFHEDGCRSGVSAARSLGVDW